VPFAPSFDTVGIFAHRVSDAVVAARVLMPPFLHRQTAVASPLTIIGIVDDPVIEAASAAVAGSMRTTGEALAAAGVGIKRLQSPVPFAEISAWHKTIIEYEVAHAHPQLEHDPQVSAGLREAVGRGRLLSDQAYLDAHAALADARERFWAATAQADALLFPAAPDVAPAGMKTGDPRFIVPFTALGGPIVSIPVGTGAENLPLGVMLIGAPGSDAGIGVIAERIAPVIEMPR
jgi:aspartyl-tRNA(Asn)/glutamyl-tRNA(Gln) amidotransferase subunit A